MKSILRLILILGLFLTSGLAKASHITGGDFQYTCIGQDSFLIRLNIFRDCTGISAPTSPQVDFTSSCGGNFSVNLTLTNPGGTEVSQLCPTALNNSSCNGGSLPGMEHYIYEAIVVLSPTCNSWTMSWDDCCRNSPTNASSVGTYISAGMNSATDDCNNSPQYTAQPIPYVCQNQVVNYNFGVVEQDGDSLVYSMVTGLSAATTPIPYTGGYSFTQPFGTAVPITLNQATGQLTFTPPSTGLYVVVVRVDEYDPVTGAHLGYVFRDIQIVVQPCSNLVPVVASPGITNFTGTGALIDSNSLEVCIGQSLNFDIVFTDPDTSSPGDSITLFSNILQALDSTANITVTNGNPATINVDWIAQPGNGNFAAFNVTAIDDACNVSGLINAAFDITILPSTYAGEDQTICQGTQTATLIATGGSQFTWTVISGDPISVGVNFSCDTCDTTIASPSITTTYQVVSNLSSTCSNTDTVTVFVAPDYTLTLPDDDTICSISDFQLFANTNQPSFTYTYAWNNTATLSDPSISNPLANPIQPTTYTVTVTSAAGCQKTDNVTISLSPPFPDSSMISGDTVLCQGTSTQLGLDFGASDFGYCGLSTTGCMGVTQTASIGAGTQTNSSSSYPSIWAGGAQSARHQILYTAADLQALGMTNGGQINSIAFDIATVGAVTQFTNFSVKMKCTSVSDLSSAYETGLIEVVAPYTHTVTNGWNTINFPTPYWWDGVSNLVIEVCYNNAASIFNTNSQQRFTSTLYQSVRYTNSSFQGVCFGGGFEQTSTERPNLQLNFCTGTDPNALTYQWTPSTALSSTTIENPIANPTTDITYQVIITDTFGGCSDTITHFIDVVTEFNPDFSFNDPYCISADADTGVAITDGGVWSGVGITDGINGVFDPAAAGIGTHQITYTITGNCANDTTLPVQVISLPDASINAPDQYCIDGTPFALSAATAGGVFSGNGVNSATSEFDPSSLTPGTYDIIYNLTIPCPHADTHKIEVLDSVPFTAVTPITICDNETMVLLDSVQISTLFTEPTLTDFQGTGITNTANGAFNANGIPAASHDITVTVTDTFGLCASTDVIQVIVNATEYNELLKDTYCSDEANVFLQTTKPLINSTWTNTPADPANTAIVFNAANGFSPEDYDPGVWVFDFTYTNINGCTGVSQDSLYILETPDDPVPDSDDFCEGDIVELTSSYNNPDSLEWSWDDNGTTVDLGSGSPNTNFGPAPDPANGTITVQVREVNGICVSNYVSYVLPIQPAPAASFVVDWTDTSGVQHFDSLVVEGDTIYGNPQSIWLRAQGYSSTDSLAWDLNFNDWSGNGDVIQNFQGDVPALPQDFNSPGLHELLLVHTNEYGCEDQYSIFLEIIGTEQIANIFTPNGDGINDLFYVIAPVRDFNVEIYNRWGHMIYEYDCNQCSQKDKGWNGGDHPDGTYFFIVTGTRVDGSDYVQKGTVTLTGGN